MLEGSEGEGRRDKSEGGVDIKYFNYINATVSQSIKG